MSGAVRRARAFRAALRIARRDAWRAKVRSALVVAMVALPVLGVSAADVLARTADPGPGEVAASRLGTGTADAAVTFDYVDEAILQDPKGDGWISATDAVDGGPAATAATAAPQPSRRSPRQRLAGLLPPGSRAITDAGTQALMGTAHGVTVATLRELDYADPIATGLVRQVSGRAPRRPGEVALTEALAQQSGLEIGSVLRLPHVDRTYRVVGVVRDPADWDARTAFALPDGAVEQLWAADGDDVAARRAETRFLVDLPTPLTWAEVQRWNETGAFVMSRAVLLDPPPAAHVPYYARGFGAAGGGPVSADSVTALVVVVGMALLEVVLLAGPAFAVGARRSRRQLALVAATGGTRAHVRDVVLGQGVVLGVAGGAAGTVAGVAVAVGALPLAERLARHDYPAPDLRPAELLGVAAVGLLTAVAAAVVPARQASRADVVAALAGRRGTVRTPRRVPVIGAVLALAGAALAGYGAVHGTANAILGGSMVAEIGLVLCTPTLVGWAGQLAPRLPLAPRIALRDAARNRMRTAPAVAAVMAAVAGSVAVGCYLVSLSVHDRAEYAPAAAPGQVVLEQYDQRVDLGQTVTTVRAQLPVTGVLQVRSLSAECGDTGRCSSVQLAIPAANACPADREGDAGGPASYASAAQVTSAATDWRCRTMPNALFQRPTYVVEPSQLATLTGVRDARAEAVLRAGGVVVSDPRLVHDGKAQLDVVESSASESATPTTVRVPAVLLDQRAARVSRAIMTPALAKRLHAPVRVDHVVLTTSTPVSDAMEQRAQDALDAFGPGLAHVSVERGYVDHFTAGLLALAATAALITLGAAGIATGLALTDARSDLVTLAAVGASPRVRRRLAAAQAGVITGIGTVLGVLAGFVPAATVIYARSHPAAGVPDGEWHFVVPWAQLGLTAVVVPAVAIVAAAALARARIPIERRAA